MILICIRNAIRKINFFFHSLQFVIQSQTMKITRDILWKILNWTIVPILGSFSYFFITEAWTNYNFGKTNMSFDELVIPEQPAVTLCIDNPKSSMEKRLSLRTLYFEVYYYKHFDWANSNYTRIKLEEGENELDGEIITFTKMQWCVSISTENYQHVDFEERLIAISFLDLKSTHLDIQCRSKVRTQPLFYTVKDPFGG